MIENLSPREKNLVYATLAAVVLGVLAMGYGAMNQSGGMSQNTMDDFEDLFAQMQSIDEQKETNLTIRKRLGALQGVFVREDEQTEFISELQQVAGQAGVGISNINTAIKPRTRPLPTLEADIQLTCQYPQLIQFFDRLRNAKYIMQPSGFRVSLADPNRPDLQVRMSIKTFLIESRPGAASPTSLTQGGSS